MEWLEELFNPEILSVSFFILICLIIAVFYRAALKARRKHQRRIEKLRQFDPN